VEPLIKALADNYGDARKAAAEALAGLGEPVWKDAVRGDRSDWGRLGKLSDPRLVSPIIQRLDFFHGREKHEVALALLTILKAHPEINILDRKLEIKIENIHEDYGTDSCWGSHDDINYPINIEKFMAK
jgi:HEAT repeat protein